MKKITVRLGVLDRGESLPCSDFALDGLDVAQHFMRAPGGLAGGNARVVLDASDPQAAAVPAGDTNILRLQRSLRRFVGEQPLNAPSPRVGVIYADFYTPHPSVFGLMFDTPFEQTADDLSIEGVPAECTDVPREGCAVFVGAIRQKRALSEHRNEILFTTIHELGHVFNLWHIEDTSNFMASSPGDAAFDRGAFHFEKEHVEFLDYCADVPYVYPTGTPFGIRGSLAPPGVPNVNIWNAPEADAMAPTLRIDMDQKSFWRFEPVELEVRLSLPRKAPEQVVLPDALDPGYDRFAIWIEQPNGERVLYRTTKRYCLNPAVITLRPGRHFERDISIFGQGGGYTFTMPGVHTLMATFRLPDGRVLRSNSLCIEIKQALCRSGRYRRLAEVLADPLIAQALYYRSGRPRPAHIQALEELAGRERRSPVSAGIHYALGRLFEGRGRGNSSSAQEFRKRAYRHLQRAGGHAGLSPHRRRRAEVLSQALAIGIRR